MLYWSYIQKDIFQFTMAESASINWSVTSYDDLMYSWCKWQLFDKEIGKFCCCGLYVSSMYRYFNWWQLLSTYASPRYRKLYILQSINGGKSQNNNSALLLHFTQLRVALRYTYKAFRLWKFLNILISFCLLTSSWSNEFSAHRSMARWVSLFRLDNSSHKSTQDSADDIDIPAKFKPSRLWHVWTMARNPFRSSRHLSFPSKLSRWRLGHETASCSKWLKWIFDSEIST